ncbi:RNA-dependent RNA polymerase [Aspergillus lentulus narnavirus 1]|nr:RNA-dependent RNA polymerase [Aspergillus lentulus narnavirus 1]
MRPEGSVAQASDNPKDDRNHHTSGSLDPNANLLGLAHSLDIYLPKPLVKQIGRFGKQESLANRRRRVQEALPVSLPDDVLDKICRSSEYRLKRISNFIEAVNDNLLMSTPDRARRFLELPSYRKILKWGYCLSVHNTDKATKQWKKFSALLKWKALRSETQEPEIPDDFPGFGAQRDSLRDLPPIWREMCPWLQGVWDRGVVSKAEATRLQHLVTSRNMPAGGKKTRVESLRKHAETLHLTPEPDPIREGILRRLCVLIGRQVRGLVPKNFKSLGHLSLTSSASIDSPVSEGGRAAEVAVKFRTWANKISDEDVSETTWFGAPYRLVAGSPRWQTMCREVPVINPHHEFGESAEDMILDFENFKYEDPLYGLDHVTGLQLLQWSLEEALSNGLLLGSPYRSGDLLRKGSVAPSIRASAIGEPGAKSRVVTVGEDSLTIFLQPFSHHLLGLAKLHPSVTAGLSRGWQLYEWCKGLRNAAPVRGQATYFLSSDLSTATDFCRHDFSKAMIEGFMEGLGESSPYLSAACELLCSPRRYESDIEGFFDSLTSRGILMGDPGAKLVLTLHNLCAEWEAFIRYHLNMVDTPDPEFYSRLRRSRGGPAMKWRHFACSGDDHTGQGPKDYLLRITKNHELNGMSVSWPQNFLSSRGSFYCEEMFLTVGLSDSEIWGVETPLHLRPYLRQPHIDAMKLRLLSPCAKEHEGKDEPNPAIGKARQMQGMLAWLGGGFEAMVPMASARFEARMEAFLPPQLGVRYLPVKLGGIGAPAFHRSQDELARIFDSLSNNHKQAIQDVLGSNAPVLVRETLATFATNARARGISSDAVQDQVKEVLSNAELTLGIDDSGLQLLTQTNDTDWQNLRFSDKKVLAKRAGFITVDDAINMIDRPYLFRNMLAPEISRRHGEEPYKDKAYDVLPWEVRVRRLEQNLVQSYGEHLSEPREFLPTARQLAKWAAERGQRLDLPVSIYFIPESVVVSDSLCTLRVPL